MISVGFFMRRMIFRSMVGKITVEVLFSVRAVVICGYNQADELDAGYWLGLFYCHELRGIWKLEILSGVGW